VTDLLNSLGRRYRLGLLTNGSTEMQWPKVRDLDLEPLFHTIIVAGDHGVYKPDGEAFRLLAERLGTHPDRTLFVGDNYESDVRGAHEAGMRTAWLRHPGAEASEPVCHDIELEAIGELEAQCS
jgi:HAD superfamily hydrolase (TIGR01549 family)